MKVYIAYGWPEGQWHGKNLRKALIEHGFQIASSIEDADIILAHSAGCYMIPDKVRAKLIVLVGLPNWPSRLTIVSTYEKLSLEAKNAGWFQKTFWHVVYALSQPIRLMKTYKAFRKKILPSGKPGKIVLVHNKLDTYMNDLVSNELAERREWNCINLDGQHDDLWQNPTPYLEIIRQYSKTSDA